MINASLKYYLKPHKYLKLSHVYFMGGDCNEHLRPGSYYIEFNITPYVGLGRLLSR